MAEVVVAVGDLEVVSAITRGSVDAMGSRSGSSHDDHQIDRSTDPKGMSRVDAGTITQSSINRLTALTGVVIMDIDNCAAGRRNWRFAYYESCRMIP